MQYFGNLFNRFNDYPPARKITISFLLVIICGTLLLMLPVSNQNHQYLNFLDALFTTVSATCVTGLVTLVPAEQFTFFGQVVLIFLMQIGGIGLITLVASFMIVLKNKLSLNDKIALKEVLNQENFINFKAFLRVIIKYTFVFEGIATLLLCFVFIPDFGWGKGIFTSFFISVSAFCNAGFDVIGAESLIPYADHLLVNLVVMGLIILGGLGFVVWFDVREKLKAVLHRKLDWHYLFRSLTLHTRLVMIATMILVLIPALLILILEYHNPATLGPMNLYEKIIASLFSSVTLRTAGFASISFVDTYMASKFIMVLVMFIGGSPGGTAGGIKTTTLLVVFLCVLRSLRGQSHTNVFHRHISRAIIVRSTTIICINCLTLFLGVFLLSISESFDFLTILFEATSALATVGLSLSATPLLSTFGKIVIMWLMFVGRIGIMTFIMSIIKDKAEQDNIQYAEAHIVVG